MIEKNLSDMEWWPGWPPWAVTFDQSTEQYEGVNQVKLEKGHTRQAAVEQCKALNPEYVCPAGGTAGLVWWEPLSHRVRGKRMKQSGRPGPVHDSALNQTSGHGRVNVKVQSLIQILSPHYFFTYIERTSFS